MNDIKKTQKQAKRSETQKSASRGIHTLIKTRHARATGSAWNIWANALQNHTCKERKKKEKHPVENMKNITDQQRQSQQKRKVPTEQMCNAYGKWIAGIDLRPDRMQKKRK
jgi:ABC-type uncharacterized transport system ATPase subunit